MKMPTKSLKYITNVVLIMQISSANSVLKVTRPSGKMLSRKTHGTHTCKMQVLPLYRVDYSGPLSHFPFLLPSSSDSLFLVPFSLSLFLYSSMSFIYFSILSLSPFHLLLLYMQMKGNLFFVRKSFIYSLPH